MGVKKDVADYAYAKMNYGEGAGLLRRKVFAKIADKMKDPSYAEQFNAEFAKINLSDFTQKVEMKHAVDDTVKVVKNGFKFTKNVLAGLGITATGLVIFYITNKEFCDFYIHKFFDGTKNKLDAIKRNISSKIEKMKEKRKAKKLKKITLKTKKKRCLTDFIDINSINQK